MRVNNNYCSQKTMQWSPKEMSEEKIMKCTKFIENTYNKLGRKKSHSKNALKDDLGQCRLWARWWVVADEEIFMKATVRFPEIAGFSNKKLLKWSFWIPITGIAMVVYRLYLPELRLPSSRSPSPKSEPMLPEPIKSEPLLPEPMLPEPMLPEPIKSEPVLPEPMLPEPIQSKPLLP